MCKIMNFKAKKGKNKYNKNERWIKRSQYLKTIFLAIKTKIQTGYDQRLTFLSDH